MINKILITIAVLFFGVIFLIIWTAPVPNTKGLFEKLENLEGVVRVKDYKEDEITVSFTLELSENKSISFIGVDNTDLINSETIVVRGLSNANINCKKNTGNSTRAGVFATELEGQLKSNIKLRSIQAVVNNYIYLEEIFSDGPIALEEISPPLSGDWTCGFL